MTCAGAETASGLVYQKDGFTVSIPEGWDNEMEEDGVAFYYTLPEGSSNPATLMILASREESFAGAEMTEEELKQIYNNNFLQNAAAQSTDNNVNYFYSTMADVLSVVYCCRQEINGKVTSVAFENVIIDGWIFGMAISHEDSEPDGLAGYLDLIGSSVTYTGAKAPTLADLPTKEEPYRFTPGLANQQNYLTAQWMIDGSTMALCTMLLTLDMDIAQGTFSSGSHPMNIFASYIGCAEDTIRTIIPSEDETIAYIFEYNTVEGTALYYAEPWNEDTLAAFEASCTDQYYANTEDALNHVLQILMNAFTAGASE